MNKFILSSKNINYRLFISLLFLGFCPTIYTTVRIFFVGQLSNEWAYSIAGQLNYINLIYEILSESIILPLFYFIGTVISNKDEFTNRVKSGLFITALIYTIFSFLIIVFIDTLLSFMATDKNIFEASKAYIRLESVANIFSMLSAYALVALVALNKNKYLYLLTIVRLILSLLLDSFLVSTLPFSLNLGVNGIAYSNIIVNIILLLISIIALEKEGINILSTKKMSFAWMLSFVKIGGISGIESLVRNLAYMLMIVRMVNVVGEQGTYWVANSFIWSWLLLPVIQLAELIKQEISTNKDAIRTHTLGYFFITFCICIIWILSIPLWKPFMLYVLNYQNVDVLFNLVITLLVFYMLFAFQNVFDATFYALGKTNYMLFESIATNSIYYGCAFILYSLDIFIPSLTNIALLFGFGIAFDSIVSFLAYLYLIKKEKISFKVN